MYTGRSHGVLRNMQRNSRDRARTPNFGMFALTSHADVDDVQISSTWKLLRIFQAEACTPPRAYFFADSILVVLAGPTAIA
jgi:hypothetical protein